METSTRADFVIYFASQTGTAENFAAILKREAADHNLSAQIINLANITKEEFVLNQNCVFIMATHYEGDPPDNAAKFWTWFSDEKSWGSEYLNEHCFTCFALGDTNYEKTFARIGQETNRLMLKYGAKSIYKLGIGSNDEDDIESYFNKWKSQIWDSLVSAFTDGAPFFGNNEYTLETEEIQLGQMEEEEIGLVLSDEKKSLPYDCIISSFKKEVSLENLDKNNKKYDFRLQNFLQHDQFKIINVTELRHNPTNLDFSCMLELLLPKGQGAFGDSQNRYPISGNISIYPKNEMAKVDRLARLLNMPSDMVITVHPRNAKTFIVPEVLTIKTFGESLIDLNGKISEKDYSQLEELLTEQEYHRVKKFRKRMQSQKKVYDILDLFEDVKITTSDLLSVLISLGKDIKVSRFF